MPHSHSEYGEKKDGSTKSMIHEDGFSGIAVTTWAGACQRKTNGRSSVGKPFEDTLRK